MKLKAKELRVSEPTEMEKKKIKRRPIYIVCDNILDTYNLGSIFRLADAVAASKVYLCAGSETPPNTKIARASVGTDKWVPWEYKASASEAIGDLRRFHSRPQTSHSELQTSHSELDSESADSRFCRNDTKKGIRIIAIEQNPKAVDFRKANYHLPSMNHEPSTMNHQPAVAFVLGHETTGLSSETLKLCDEIVEIPMFGVNISLNVMVSLAIVLFRAI